MALLGSQTTTDLDILLFTLPVSAICEVTWRIFVSRLLYEKKWISYKLGQALDIFLEILHGINKVQICCSIFSIKTSSKFHPSASSFDLLATFFYPVICKV